MNHEKQTLKYVSRHSRGSGDIDMFCFDLFMKRFFDRFVWLSRETWSVACTVNTRHDFEVVQMKSAGGGSPRDTMQSGVTHAKPVSTVDTLYKESTYDVHVLP